MTNPDNITLDAEKLTTMTGAIRGMVAGDLDISVALETMRTVGEEVFAPHQKAIAAGTARIPGFCLFDETGYDLELALRSIGPGWAQIIRDLYAVMPPEVRVEQVKEKFGGLRFYYGWKTSGDDRPVSTVRKWLGYRWFRLTHYRVPALGRAFRWVHDLWHRVTGLYSTYELWEQAVHRAESLSYKTCENCGQPGEPSHGGWIVTECAACHDLVAAEQAAELAEWKSRHPEDE